MDLHSSSFQLSLRLYYRIYSFSIGTVSSEEIFDTEYVRIWTVDERWIKIRRKRVQQVGLAFDIWTLVCTFLQICFFVC